jgi:tRNA 2-selenouridine synthase
MRFLTWQECSAAGPFTGIIDVRSPGEFAEDRIPGAVNLPVLDDAQRAEIGRLYVQVSRFDARRLGAAMVAENIAQHLASWFAPHPEHARFLIYCWRCGHRSRSMATILHAVGWQVTVLAGGYKAYRRHVREVIAEKAPLLHCRIISGLTGSGKSRLLRHMAAAGHQVIDLEAMGRHRGSLLGDEPGGPQPAQRHFETLIAQSLAHLDPARPVWIESESKRLGRLWIPEPLWQSMAAAPVHELNVPAEVRAAALLEDYTHFTSDPAALSAKLETLKATAGAKRLAEWHSLIAAQRWPEFVLSLLEHHYDPCYRRCREFQTITCRHTATDLSSDGLAALTTELTAAASRQLH